MTNERASIKEDSDPLVAAVTRLCEPEDIFRRPGIIAFGVSVPGTEETIVVSRTRFDGEYGDICRLVLNDADGYEKDLAYAPTQLLLSVMTEKEELGARLAAFHQEWLKKGKE